MRSPFHSRSAREGHRAFAVRAQSGQETRPASPMISPTRYGPKRASQPAV